MLSALALSSFGSEDICAEELSFLTGAGCKLYDGHVFMEINSREDIAKAAYLSQSADRIIEHLISVGITDDKISMDALQRIADSVFRNGLLKTEDSFRVSYIDLHVGSSNKLCSDVLCADIGSAIIGLFKENNKSPPKVDLKDPGITVIAVRSKEKLHVGIDYSMEGMHKRSYRLFCPPRTVRATLSYALLHLSKISEDTVVLDPFVGSGTILIEAAHKILSRSVRFHDKDKIACGRFLKSGLTAYDRLQKKVSPMLYGFASTMSLMMNAKKNAKIAGVEKSVSLSRVDVDWIDSKFSESSVDRVITHPPEPSRSVSSQAAAKIYKEFFYQVKYILKEDGLIGAMLHDPGLLISFAEKDGFYLQSQRKISAGMETLVIIMLSRKKPL